MRKFIVVIKIDIIEEIAFKLVAIKEFSMNAIIKSAFIRKAITDTERFGFSRNGLFQQMIQFQPDLKRENKKKLCNN